MSCRIDATEKLNQFYPEKIYVDRAVAALDSTESIIGSAPDAEVEIVDDPPRLREPDKAGPGLYLTRQRGKFFKRCPGTRNYVCCLYNFLNVATGCPYRCSYCILKAYLDSPVITVFVNLDDLVAEISELFERNPGTFYRVGTGELTDSLVLDHITGVNRRLIPAFSQVPNAVFEIKTKSAGIGHLLQLEEKRNIIISWSVNTDRVIREEEVNTPSLQERLEAARECQRQGRVVGLHIDPIIYYDNWEEEYLEMVDTIASYLDLEKVIWISMGSLRFPKEFKRMYQETSGYRRTYLAEFVPGLDNKLRYLQPIRIKLYRTLAGRLRQHEKNTCLYLCMESAVVWKKALEMEMPGSQALSDYLDRRARKMFSLP